MPRAQPAGESSEQSDLSQSQSRRRADSDSRVDLGHLRPRPAFDAASTIIQQKLLQIEGVGSVNVGGGALPAVRVDVNPTLLNSFGLSLTDVSAMLAQQNANLAKGQLADDRTTLDILANDQLLKAADYQKLIVAVRNGAAIRLSDVANVQDSVEKVRAAGYLTASRPSR